MKAALSNDASYGWTLTSNLRILKKNNFYSIVVNRPEKAEHANGKPRFSTRYADQNSTTERGSSRHFRHGSVLLELTVVSFRGVITDEIEYNTSCEGDDGRDDTKCTPSLLGVAIVDKLEKRETADPKRTMNPYEA